ncbi:MAG TPA: pentapeptide repeat-containing protein [Streptosporangiaceae bacterium]|jgi:uncharacterized protein YjbI with pentapeptide repeats
MPFSIPSLRTRAFALATAAGLAAALALFAVPAAQAAVACPAVVNGVVTPAPQAEVNWRGCSLVGAFLSDANLGTADLAGANLSSADLTGALLANADLTGADMFNANLTGADLAGASLLGATVGNANLSATNLAGADLIDVRSGGVDAELLPSLPAPWSLVSGYLIGPFADLDGAMLGGASLAGDDLDHAILDDATLSGADLSDANLIQAEIGGADLDGADLDGTNFTEADLTEADLANAINYATAIWNGVTWGGTTCPDGTNSSSLVAGCFSAPDTTPPSAAVTLDGTLGSNGWYVSDVTANWNWTDNVVLNFTPGNCLPVSSTSGSGVQTLTATCQDRAGNVGTASVTVKVDLTTPVVSVTGVRSGAVYAKGKVPKAGCSTTEAVSGVATPATVRVATSGSNGVGRFTATCSGAVSVAGTTQAAPVQVSYTVAYGLSAWTTPRPGSTITKSSGRVTAEFRLAGAANGTPVLATVAAALGRAHDVEVTLRGPDIKSHTAVCSWVAAARVFRCTIAMPPGAEKGASHSYTLTVTENVGSGFKTVPIAGTARNREVIHFR